MRWGLLLLVSFFSACQTELDCQLDPNSNSFYIAFNDDEVNVFQFDSVKNNLISTVFFDADSSFNLVQLPLTETTNELTYTFYTDSLDYDLTLSYESQINLYGEDCPPSTFFFNLDVVSYTFFDTVIVSNSEVDRRFLDNIQVFF